MEVVCYTTVDVDPVFPLNIEQEGFFDRVRFFNDYQDSGFQALNDSSLRRFNIRKVERTWQMPVFRNSVVYGGSSGNIATLPTKAFGERMRGNYLFTEMEYDNLFNHRLTIDLILMSYRQSLR